MKKEIDIDKDFTPEQYDRLVKDFNKLLQIGTPSTSLTSLLNQIAEEGC